MPKKTKARKTGVTGKYGARYGAVNRRRVRDVLNQMKSKNITCPQCKTKDTVHRVSTGIWKCKKCNSKFTGGAYSIQTPRGAEAFRVTERKQRELEMIEEE
jgi:large subunit ribosomal protein L37Ae